MTRRYWQSAIWHRRIELLTLLSHHTDCWAVFRVLNNWHKLGARKKHIGYHLKMRFNTDSLKASQYIKKMFWKLKGPRIIGQQIQSLEAVGLLDTINTPVPFGNRRRNMCQQCPHLRAMVWSKGWSSESKCSLWLKTNSASPCPVHMLNHAQNFRPRVCSLQTLYVEYLSLPLMTLLHVNPANESSSVLYIHLLQWLPTNCPSQCL